MWESYKNLFSPLYQRLGYLVVTVLIGLDQVYFLLDISMLAYIIILCSIEIFSVNPSYVFIILKDNHLPLLA